MNELKPLDKHGATLRELAQECLSHAKTCGATSAEVAVHAERGLSVTARLGHVETVEHHNSQGLGITVYFGAHKGAASTTDFTIKAVHETVKAACSIAKYTQEDLCAGLADAELMAYHYQDLDLDHPWSLNVDQALELALTCEDAARSMPQIENSEGATVNTVRSSGICANTHGFIGEQTGTRHDLSCVAIAKRNGDMQRDYWYSTARDPKNLEPPQEIGETAAIRATKRLGARKLKTQNAPILFEASVARSLISNFVSAINGDNLYRKASFLVDYLGKQLFPAFIQIGELPHLLGKLGSTPYDLEGVATKERNLVRGGVLQGYVLDSYSGRKLGLATTGNAGGVHNLTVEPGANSLVQLLGQMRRGLFVTELIGHGINLVNGDYSRGAVGFWVENGEIQYPVHEVTIAGNLGKMFLNIIAVGNDQDERGTICTPSILIGDMMIAGA